MPRVTNKVQVIFQVDSAPVLISACGENLFHKNMAKYKYL